MTFRPALHGPAVVSQHLLQGVHDTRGKTVRPHWQQHHVTPCDGRGMCGPLQGGKHNVARSIEYYHKALSLRPEDTLSTEMLTLALQVCPLSLISSFRRAQALAQTWSAGGTAAVQNLPQVLVRPSRSMTSCGSQIPLQRRNGQTPVGIVGSSLTLARRARLVASNCWLALPASISTRDQPQPTGCGPPPQEDCWQHTEDRLEVEVLG